MVRYPMLNLIMETQIFVRITWYDFTVAVAREESNACLKHTMGSSSACSIDFEAV